MMSPDTAAEEETIPFPPAQTAREHSRRYFWVSGWMLLGLCALNLALFRQEGLDWLAAAALGLGLVCLAAGTRRLAWLRRLGLVWIFLSLPFWALAALLLYEMALGGWNGLQPVALPGPALAWTPAPKEHADALDILIRKYPRHYWSGPPGASPRLSDGLRVDLNQLGQALNELNATRFPHVQGSPRDPAALVEDPGLAATLERVTPFLDEYLADRLAAGPLGMDERGLDPQYHVSNFLLRRQSTQAQFYRILALEHKGERATAQELFLNLLKTSDLALQPSLWMVNYSIEMSNLRTLLEYQANFASDLLRGREEDAQALLATIRERLPEAQRSMFQLSYHLDQAVINQHTPREMEVVSNDAPLYFHDWASAGESAMYVVGRAFQGRAQHWPFYDRRDMLSRHTQLNVRLLAALETPPRDQAPAVENVLEELGQEIGPQWVLRPNPTGRWLMANNQPSFDRIVSLTLLLQSRLAAHEYLLTWQRGPIGTGLGEVPIDPMTERPFLASLRLLLETPGGEELVLGGGDPHLGTQVQREELPALQQAGLHKQAHYVLRARRETLRGGPPQVAPQPPEPPPAASLPEPESVPEPPPPPPAPFFDAVLPPGEEVIEVTPR